MASLKEKSQTILDEKQLNLLPENIKKDITIFGVTGTYDNGSGVKLFETIDEMNSDTNAKENDLAVVYRSEITNMTSDSVISSITFPEQVVLVEAFTDSVYCRLRAENSSVMFDGNIILNENSFRFNGFTDSGMIMVEYSSDDGITYNRTRFENDNGDLTNPVNLDTNVIVGNAEEWSDIIGQFILVGGNIFEGLYNYKIGILDNNYVNFIDTFKFVENNIQDLVIKKIYIKPILDLLYTVIPNNILFRPTFLVNKTNNNDIYVISNNGVNIYYMYDTTLDSLLGSYVKATPDKIYHINLETTSIDEVLVDECDWYKTTGTKHYADATNYYTFVVYQLNSDYMFDTGGPVNGFYLSVDNGSEYSTATELYSKLVYKEEYVLTNTQLNANKNNVYNAIAYGKDGIISGDITVNVANTFNDINAEIFYKLQNIYNNMEPVVVNDDTDLSNLYFIPTNKDGTVLLDTSNIIDGSYLFSHCAYLTNVPPLDTHNITNMNYMFGNCSNLESIGEIDTSNATTMDGMFYENNKLSHIPNMNTSKVTDFSRLCVNCGSLVDFPQIDTSKAKALTAAFHGCKSLVDFPVLNAGSITGTGLDRVFTDCSSLSDDSLNNIMQLCISAVNQGTSIKTLKYIGLSEEQATKCTTLSNYEAFTTAGWTTGY